MIFARYLAHGEVSYGVVEGDMVKQLTTPPFERFKVTDHVHPLSHVKLLAPCTPHKILAIGLNYRSHLGEREPLKEPLVFYKTPTSVIGPEESIVIPKAFTGRVDEEGELVAVIKDRCKNVSPGDALKHVLGYTCGNDVSAREWQRGDGQWWRAKSSDTFSPVGPYIVTDIDPSNLLLKARVNGKEVQSERTSMFLFDIPTVISFLSRAVTLVAGDLIYTGTPGRPGQLHPGDVVEVEIEKVGTLRNSVKAEA